MAGVDKEFDYLVPERYALLAAPGALVRADLAGRRVGGWVLAAGVSPPAGVSLRPLAKVRGMGPEPAVLDLAEWAAWRWAGRRRSLLATASPAGAVTALPAPALRTPAPPGGVPVPLGALPAGEVTVVRVAPAVDLTPLVAAVAQAGPTLVVVPAHARAAVLAGRLRRAGAGVALLPGDWAQARAGAGVVIGSRAAAWGPCPGMAAVVVVDGHDEALRQEQAPTWSAAAVAAERARRAGVPCVITSPCPTLEMLAGAGGVRAAEPEGERHGWAPLEIIDRAGADPRLGLWSERVVSVVRGGGKVLAVLNRTGRARLLACRSCGSLARCERCGAAAEEADTGVLRCDRCGEERPVVCASCYSTALARLRPGVTRAREQLEALAGRPVGEVTASSGEVPDTPVLIGTEAVLHRVGRADAVIFLDFDQHLLAARYRAGEEALSLLARASRLVGGRRRGTGRVLVQTRVADHPALAAAAAGDPTLLAAAEESVRAALRLPPFSAMAALSGEGAAPFASGLAALPGSPVEVSAAGAGGTESWVVRAGDHGVLCDALAAVERPAGRLRVEVDPLGV